jgi:ferrous iron transport protein B
MKRVVLLGMPNTGKSTFFNRVSGASAKVGNWPGVTVDLMTAKLLLGGHITELVDLPGIYDLHGFSDDEHLVRHFLSETPIDLIIILANSGQIDRQLSLALQIKSLNIPTLLLLNMHDEAKRSGIRINTGEMANKLGMPVLQISAKYGDQIPEALALAGKTMQQQHNPMSRLGTKASLKPDIEIEKEMERVLSASVEMPIQMGENMTASLDNVLLNRFLGLPLFFATLYLLFQFIFTVGKPIQDGIGWILTSFRGEFLEPWMSHTPHWLSGLMLDGVYNGIGTVLAFVPIIILFFLVMTLVEDSGYLSRAAFLMDALMAKLGLDGRGFVMVLMGFGCNVPALMGTRVMRSRKMRLLTMLIIPFSLCSARLQVFLFMTSILFTPHQAPLVLFVLYLMSFFAILVTAILFKRNYQNNEPFILELPPYRLPTLRQILLRGWQEVKYFLNRASTFILFGVILVWALTHLPPGVDVASQQTYAGKIGHLFAPFMRPIGIDESLTITLIFGFVAKEIVIGSLAVIYGLQGDALTQVISHQVNWVQGMSFMLFTLIYTPCLSTIITLKNEAKSWLFAATSIVWSLILAWLVSFMFYQAMHLFGL